MTPAPDKVSKTVCLNMIVKDEAHVIRRCLASVIPLIDAYLVVDTGSTDGTQEIIREALAGIPGRVVERPWIDFAHNRSEALELAREWADYSFIIDADDELELAPDFAKAALEGDSVTIDIRYGAIAYRRPHFVRNALPWRWSGVVHEFLTCPEARTQTHAPGIAIVIRGGGARSADPRKFERDVQALEAALRTETDPFLVARYRFYLAQSCRDAGRIAEAITHYRIRAELNFWDQEVYYSLYQVAALLERTGAPAAEVIAAYRAAIQACPARAEAHHGASRFCRLKGRYQEGFALAAEALELPPFDGALFGEDWIYAYGLRDEYAINAYWAGHFKASLESCLRLLRSPALPADYRDRVLRNAEFAAARLAEPVVFRSQEAQAPQAVTQAVTQAEPRPGAEVQVFRKQFRVCRTIHIVWVGDESRRPDACIETWRRLNPDWSVVVWGNRELENTRWRNAAHIREMWGRELCGVADMMRWEILAAHGGFAIDADSICVRPLETWLFEPEIFACWENEIVRPGLVANGYVYAHPRNPLIERIVADIGALPEVSSKRAWELVGPQRLTDTIYAMRYTDITIYPSHYFIPEHLSGIKYSGQSHVFAEQLWGSSRPQPAALPAAGRP